MRSDPWRVIVFGSLLFLLAASPSAAAGDEVVNVESELTMDAGLCKDSAVCASGYANWTGEVATVDPGTCAAIAGASAETPTVPCEGRLAVPYEDGTTIVSYGPGRAQWSMDGYESAGIDLEI